MKPHLHRCVETRTGTGYLACAYALTCAQHGKFSGEDVPNVPVLAKFCSVLGCVHSMFRQSMEPFLAAKYKCESQY